MPEGNCKRAEHGHRCFTYEAIYPWRHGCYNTQCLTIQRLFNTFQHRYIRYGTIDIYYKATHYPTFNSISIGLGWISALMVNVVHQSHATSRKLGLDIHRIVFVNLNCTNAIICSSNNSSYHLRVQTCNNKNCKNGKKDF